MLLPLFFRGFLKKKNRNERIPLIPPHIWTEKKNSWVGFFGNFGHLAKKIKKFGTVFAIWAISTQLIGATYESRINLPNFGSLKF